MNIDRAVMSFAGVMVLAGVLLGWQVSPYWYLLDVFVGLTLFQAGITGVCPAAMFFRMIGMKPGCAFN